MQCNRNSEHLPKLLLFGTLFSALTASFVVIFQELLLKKKNKRSDQIEDKREENDEMNDNATSPRSNLHAPTTPKQRMYRLEKDGE
jgi:H+/gluconate symporter-like permease